MDTSKESRTHPGDIGAEGVTRKIAVVCLYAAALLCALLFTKQARDLKLTFAHLAVLAALAAGGPACLKALTTRQLSPIAAALAAITASWLFSFILHPASAALAMLAGQASFILLFACAAALFGREAQEKLETLWLAAFAFVGGYALLQRLGVEPVEEFRKWHSQDRVFSTFGNPDFLGAFAAFLIPLFLSRAASGGRTARAVPWWIAAGLAAGVAYWTFSRGAWLGAAAGVAVWALLAYRSPRARRYLALGAACAVLAAGAVMISGAGPYEHLVRRTDRALLWQGTVRMIAARPVLGWGLGSFALEYQPFAPAEFAERMREDNTFAEHPHSEYLAVAVETGLAGTGIFLWLLVCVIRLGLNMARGGDRSAAAALGALAAILVHAAVDRNMRLASTAVPFWLLAGALVARTRRKPVPVAPWLPPLTGYAPLVLAVPALWLATIGLRPLAASWRTQLETDFLKQSGTVPLRELEAVAEGRKNDPEFLMLLGNTYAQAGKFEDAAKTFKKALALSPRMAAAANNLGNSYFMMSDFDRAIEAYSLALSIDPDHGDARFNRAYAYFHKRDIKMALAGVDAILAKDPRNAKAIQLKKQLAP